MNNPDTTMLDKLEQDTAQFVDEAASALACTARLWDDGIIDPRDTRDLLGLLLNLEHAGHHFQPTPNHFGVARF